MSEGGWDEQPIGWDGGTEWVGSPPQTVSEDGPAPMKAPPGQESPPRYEESELFGPEPVDAGPQPLKTVSEDKPGLGQNDPGGGWWDEEVRAEQEALARKQAGIASKSDGKQSEAPTLTSEDLGTYGFPARRRNQNQKQLGDSTSQLGSFFSTSRAPSSPGSQTSSDNRRDMEHPLLATPSQETVLPLDADDGADSGTVPEFDPARLREQIKVTFDSQTVRAMYHSAWLLVLLKQLHSEEVLSESQFLQAKKLALDQDPDLMNAVNDFMWNSQGTDRARQLSASILQILSERN